MTTNITSQMPGVILPWLLFAGFISVLATLFRVFFLPRIKGRLGEAGINFRIKRLLDQGVYHLIPNVMLPTPEGTTQIDHVIVSPYGIFVLETKTYKGWIYGDEREAQWTQAIYRHKERFQNPLRQNYKHTKTLANLTGMPESYFKSLVVFVGDCTFKTAMPANVVKVQDFVGYIKSHQTPIIKEAQVPEIVSVIQEWAGTVSDEQKARHVKILRRNKAPVAASATAPLCPRCDSPMVLRAAKRGVNAGSSFYGCTRYPACKGIRPVD